ncbi:hypothetical protein AB0Y04_06930 [Loigolactobacillus coryniformis]|jgi:glucokinase|uniref:Uncharacterized protein n=1 Tax=Loigolactobacillus coryniformis subsp. torquens DSM 20004 = KCTC 3535 TaxID=1423822 RepID=A0A2D1KLC7_9LACO|nr:hypothetical protein [Loigolactobacillus coryniformis]MDT3392343.1 hypothetical protein [Bacillota bacterium]ATO42924.1 hypothetical protein LC20004_02890 [Loigolactobacillus coryniformis subsp. torquens DSM 20004 = KCTC 3535]KRK84670.1 hypothetical protein FC16_GL000909 [Loigolactobacillus coryniformis subsp. torquens DSM 20004 = KCTC 3535]MBW4801692.1 hypothetical protein [Loigolactobacillus coryniformis subsp. torquens]MBW4804392.1 hypothetical protein [Loigolactobacillus coryniformis su
MVKLLNKFKQQQLVKHLASQTEVNLHFARANADYTVCQYGTEFGNGIVVVIDLAGSELRVHQSGGKTQYLPLANANTELYELLCEERDHRAINAIIPD